MSDSATIPPSPGRLRLAHRAGYRPASRWLTTGFCCLALAVLSDTAAIESHILHVYTSQSLAQLSTAITTAIIAIAALGLLVSLATGLMSGQLGWVHRESQRRVRLGRAPDTPPAQSLVAVVATVGLVAICWPVVAGAVRGVDASASGLTSLWKTWCIHTLYTVGSVAILAGIIDLRAGFHRLWQRLHRSIAELRREYQGRRR